MSMQVSGLNGGQNCNASKKAEMQQKFDEEKAEALSAAAGNSALIAQINSISPHKGAIEELEAIIAQATQSKASQGAQSIQPNRTITMA